MVLDSKDRRGWFRQQLRVERHDLVTLNLRATQKQKELDGYETMDSKVGGKREATMAEEDGLESPGKQVLGSWMDCREGLVREIFG